MHDPHTIILSKRSHVCFPWLTIMCMLILRVCWGPQFWGILDIALYNGTAILPSIGPDCTSNRHWRTHHNHHIHFNLVTQTLPFGNMFWYQFVEQNWSNTNCWHSGCSKSTHITSQTQEITHKEDNKIDFMWFDNSTYVYERETHIMFFFSHYSFLGFGLHDKLYL